MKIAEKSSILLALIREYFTFISRNEEVKQTEGK